MPADRRLARDRGVIVGDGRIDDLERPERRTAARYEIVALDAHPRQDAAEHAQAHVIRCAVRRELRIDLREHLAIGRAFADVAARFNQARLRDRHEFGRNLSVFDRDERSAVHIGFAEFDRLGRTPVHDDGLAAVAYDVAAVVVSREQHGCARGEDFGFRKGRRRALAGRAALFVAAVDERDAHVAAFELRARERASGFGGRVAEAVQRDRVAERIFAPRCLVKDAHVCGQIGARERRARDVRIVVARRDEHGLPEARKLFEEKTHGLGTEAFGFVEIAADRQEIRVPRDREIDDAHERVFECAPSCGAAARVGEDRFEVDVGTVNDSNR